MVGGADYIDSSQAGYRIPSFVFVMPCFSDCILNCPLPMKEASLLCPTSFVFMATAPPLGIFSFLVSCGCRRSNNNAHSLRVIMDRTNSINSIQQICAVQ